MHGLCSWSIHSGINKCVCDLRGWIGDGHTGIEWSDELQRVWSWAVLEYINVAMCNMSRRISGRSWSWNGSCDQWCDYMYGMCRWLVQCTANHSVSAMSGRFVHEYVECQWCCHMHCVRGGEGISELQ